MSTDSALSTLSRYEALFELSTEINAATEIDRVAELLARRIKYVADVYSWRYVSVERSDGGAAAAPVALVIDGARGSAGVDHVPVDRLCDVELSLWSRRRVSFLEGQELADAVRVLPPQFRKDDIVQIFVCPRFGGGDLQSLLVCSKRKHPFNDADVKFLTLASQVFHDKVYLLWEQKKLRDLELAYLQQEITLRQSEKLATLGKLSAGMAHELNNPAAAAQRSAGQLRAAIAALDQAQRTLGATTLAPDEAATLSRLLASAGEGATRVAALDPLSRSDLEGAVERWLEERGVDRAWELAPGLASIGLDPAALTDGAAHIDPGHLPAILTSLQCSSTTTALVTDVLEATGRVSQIVSAMRSYTYLDQAPVQEIDVHAGLDNTLVVLGSRLEPGIQVLREYDPALPRIQAYGAELNQVWTNIIDNAISAMNGTGELRLKTYSEGPWAVVEITDTGAGIPEGIQSRIFDPFFTTKPPGAGTGLGLNISHNIVVERHRGRIDVLSRPGATRFTVRLPLDPARASGTA